ncbi:hypothetical protein L3Q82_005775 [Scortum barcoo]|uniref:Uncharacterized protein n=1 Tax=Scortum barcoo TaxID=214431 RepID=A0ACB8V6F5_9TELE|nr:hypothetical protein L3Q82_005775 [Scortum barcoo]
MCCNHCTWSHDHSSVSGLSLSLVVNVSSCYIMTSVPGTNTSDNHSLIDDSGDSASFNSTALKVCMLCLLLPIPIFAIAGNLFIMAAVARFQSLRTPTNAFVVSLAMADFLVAVLVMPFSLVRAIDSWRFGRCFCQAHFLLDVTLCTVSIFNLSCVALDRYLAVCDPLHYPARMSPRRVAMLLLLSWILPLVISSFCVSLGMYTQSPLAGESNSTQQRSQTCLAMFHAPYAFATSVISFFIPMGFMLFAYGKIFKAAQRQVRCIHTINHHTSQLQMNPRTDSTRCFQAHVERYSLKKERKAFKTLGLILGVFLFCWFPFFCVNVVHPLKGFSISPLILEASIWLGYANSSVNPFLYTLFNKKYRHVFANMLECVLLRRQLRAGLDSSLFGRQAHIVVTLETISR